MMSNNVITVSGLGKKYAIGALKGTKRQDTLRDSLSQAFRTTRTHILKRKNKMLGEDSFWALKNNSFSVAQGEVLGIIGSNGAGKSTLLKILCKVTSPTTGKAILQGRVGSLLEVGTGFHHELTGRENIFLSGAVLGMDKEHIKKRFDEIVEFSGIEKFIDTPVKRYSSGMAVRLGFAVASHLEPEILLIDEVLAVGDIVFQKRCLGKMNQITGDGRTILFVSHNLAAVRSLCSRCIYLKNGEIQHIGLTQQVVDMYQKEAITINSSSVNQDTVGEYGTRISKINVKVDSADNMKLKFVASCEEPISSLGIDIVFTGQDGAVVSKVESGVTGFVIAKAHGTYQCRTVISNITSHLNGGVYYISISLSISKYKYLLKLENVISFSVTERDIYKTGTPMNYKFCGPVMLQIDFDSSKV